LRFPLCGFVITFRGVSLKTVRVYMVDYVNKTKLPVGEIEERRKSNRPKNEIGLLHLARKRFASTPDVAFRIIVSPE